MTQPEIPMKEPVQVEVKGGESYWWCSCGRSANQPWCDGSHAGTDFQPQEFTPKRDRSMWLCACKVTKKGPYCDGSHNAL